jgi:DNA-binding transcriptional regulator YiaG|tara:strand:+ start:780 stop:1289 length:510 start_codon:yes stop_codon:yes gene_type:complete
MNVFSMSVAVKNKVKNRVPLFKIAEIAKIMGVGVSTLQHHASWGRSNFPKPKLVSALKYYYNKDEVIAWYEDRQEKLRLGVLANEKIKKPINDKNDLIAFRIFETRTNLKLSRKKLAEMIGVTEFAIAHWETFTNLKTRTKPKTENFIKLSEVTGVELSYLMAEDAVFE